MECPQKERNSWRHPRNIPNTNKEPTDQLCSSSGAAARRWNEDISDDNRGHLQHPVAWPDKLQVWLPSISQYSDWCGSLQIKVMFCLFLLEEVIVEANRRTQQE